MADPATAIIVFAHGSRETEANQMIARLAAQVSAKTGWPAHCAFLDVVQPDLRSAVSTAVDQGARRVVIVPCFLSLGVHVRQDLPRLITSLQAAFPKAEMLAAPPLEGHPGLAEMMVDRVRQALVDFPLAPKAKRMG